VAVNPEQLRAETLLASVGIEPILQAAPKLTATALDDADKFVARARAMLLRFLGGSKDEVEAPKAFDYKEVAKLLDESEQDSQVAALNAAFPDDVQDDVMAMATKAAEQLRGRLPRSTYRTTVNVSSNQPPPVSLAKFRRAWDVTNDPSILFRNMLQRTVTLDEVEAFEAAYPALYQTLLGPGGVLDECIATMKDRRGDKWDIDDESDKIVRTVTGQERFKADLARDMAAAIANAKQQATPEGQPKPNAAAARLTQAEELPGQRPIGQ